MPSRSCGWFYLLLRFSGGGGGSVGATFSGGRRSSLFLLGISVEDFVDVVFFGDPQVRSGLLITGLDFFSVRTPPGIFCFLHALSGVYVLGEWCLAVAIGRLEHDGVLCGQLSTDDVIFDAFFSVGVRICREPICARGVQEVYIIANVTITHMVVGGWGIVWSLQSGYDIHNVVHDCFVRLSLHLL
jgi:hypothetical protein